MDDELQILRETMVLKDRLQVLAQLQVSYWQSLLDQGMDPNVAGQIVLDWSRHAYEKTFDAMPSSRPGDALEDLLGPVHDDPVDARTGRVAGDPSSVAPGEPYLELVEDLDEDLDERAA